ncbi:putative amidoligase enzyme-domain-containing protein [Aspergillus cavernicola]|uniref:Amidoligase enzyme-domain-containing protein n=1 Tax=Aspergillus cavernicola TaxID=176166 RepID=A0ABR4IEQ0_9EURO
MAPASLGFGVEIEAVVQPYKIRPNWSPYQYYERLAQALRNRHLSAVADTAGSQYRRHPEHYNRWFITRDGSLPASTTGGNLSLEAVSPKLRSDGDWIKEIDLFWEAMRKVFKVQADGHCGSHIHVAPIGARFKLEELKKVAFAVCYYEQCINGLLPTERRNNNYCKPNSQSVSHLRSLLAQPSSTSLRTVATELKAKSTTTEICNYMQADRYVCWNFANTVNQTPGTTSGTIEFRGGRHLRGRFRTKRWITFTVTFVLMALDEGLVNSSSSYTVLRSSRDDVTAFWEKIKRYANQLGLESMIPSSYTSMNEGASV